MGQSKVSEKSFNTEEKKHKVIEENKLYIDDYKDFICK